MLLVCKIPQIMTCDFCFNHKESLDKTLIWLAKKIKKKKEKRQYRFGGKFMRRVDCAAREEYINTMDFSVLLPVLILFLTFFSHEEILFRKCVVREVIFGNLFHWIGIR